MLAGGTGGIFPSSISLAGVDSWATWFVELSLEQHLVEAALLDKPLYQNVLQFECTTAAMVVIFAEQHHLASADIMDEPVEFGAIRCGPVWAAQAGAEPAINMASTRIQWITRLLTITRSRYLANAVYPGRVLT